MSMLYSPSVGGFFTTQVHQHIPADAVVVTDTEYVALLDRQAAGQRIVPGPDGAPIAVDPPPAPPPPPIRTIRALAFRERLPEARRRDIAVAAVQAAAAGEGHLHTWLLDQAAASVTDLDDPRVQAGVAELLGAGLITTAERDALLADGTREET